MKTNSLVILCVLLLSQVFASVKGFHDPKACEAATTILCGTELNDQSNVGYPNKLDNYACAGEDFAADYKGSERIYRLHVTSKEVYNFTLDDVGDPELNYDIFLMEGSCEAGRCIASSTNNRNKTDFISITLDPGVYYLIVDTWRDEFGTFDLKVTCAPEAQPVYCYGAKAIHCGESILGSTRYDDNNYNSDLYNCYDGSATYNGPDNIYAFYKEHSTDHIQIELVTDNDDLNIILVANCGSNGFSCILTGVDVAGGKIIDEGDYGLISGGYYIIVDGKTSSDHGDYELLLNCGGVDESELLECNAPRIGESLSTGSINQSAYSCGERSSSNRFSLFAPEKKYYFDVSSSGNYTIRAREIGDVGMEMFLYDGVSSSASCVTAGKKENGFITINANLAIGRYIIVMDAKSIGSYDLELYGCPCETDGELTCEDPISDNNKGGGNDINGISGECAAHTIWTKSQDKVYGFTAPESQFYSFNLSEMEKDLDLFLLRDCKDPTSCLGLSTKTGSDERIRIYLSEGERIYVLVDGNASLVTTDYVVSVSCEDDTDGDGVSDEDDNCPLLANSDQLDTDLDGEGNVCDDDDDGDNVPDDVDCAPLNAAISTQPGDTCNDGNDSTINDVINSDCNCVGQADTDRDGVIDAIDQCPNTPTGATVNANGCSDGDGDGFFPGAVGDLNDPDDADPCVPDNSSIDCQEVVKPIQISVENGSGVLGDTVCVDVVATDFINVASTSFSITIDNDLARILSITNVGLSGGSYTGSISQLGGTGSGSGMTGSGGQMTGSGSGSKGFVVWSADPGQSLTLGTIATLVEVCVEIVTDTLDKATIAIDSCIKDVEFFDVQANPYTFEIGNGMITRDPTPTSMLNISGTIRNVAAATVAGVEVDLSGSMEDDMITATDGKYAFQAPSQGDYLIEPKMIQTEIEDVSLMDVLVFRKHFIYKESFSHPYQYLAADIDGNTKLSIRDELLLKNMVLGIDNGVYPYFTFVKADHSFGNVAPFTMEGEVFEYPSFAKVEQLESDMEQDFVAVRMGDLDSDLSLATVRSRATQYLQIQDRIINTGDFAMIEFKAPSNTDMAGMILSLELDEETLDLNNITCAIEGVSLDYNRLSDGTLIVSIISEGLTSAIIEDQVLLNIEVTAKNNTLLSDAIRISDTGLNSEIADQKLEMSDLKLEFSSDRNTGSQSQVSVYPNPTNRIATIEVLSERDYIDGKLDIYDVSGRQLMSNEVEIAKGKNTITLDKQVFNLNKGIIYYNLSFGEHSHNGKLIIIE